MCPKIHTANKLRVPIQLEKYTLNYIFIFNNILNFLSITSQPQTPNQPGNSIAEMMDQTYNCSKEPRPNGVAGSLSLRKGAFLHENLSASRRKSPFVNAAFMDGLPTRQFPPHYIDQYARKIFPLLFGLFNIVYWSYYLPRRWCWGWIKRKEKEIRTDRACLEINELRGRVIALYCLNFKACTFKDELNV